MGIEWKGAEEDLLGYVYRVGADSGYGVAVVVGAGGHHSDWNWELVVRVSDGLVWLGKSTEE